MSERNAAKSKTGSKKSKPRPKAKGASNTGKPKPSAKPSGDKPAPKAAAKTKQAVAFQPADVVMVPIGDIRVHPQFINSRKDPYKDLDSMVESLRKHGLHYPLTLWQEKGKDGFNVGIGFRRYFSILEIRQNPQDDDADSFEFVKAEIIRDVEPEGITAIMLRNLRENVEREDLKPLEIGRYLALLIETNEWTQQQAADYVGKNLKWVQRNVMIYNAAHGIPNDAKSKVQVIVPELKEVLETHELPIHVAYELAKQPPERQKEEAERLDQAHREGRAEGKKAHAEVVKKLKRERQQKSDGEGEGEGPSPAQGSQSSQGADGSSQQTSDGKPSDGSAKSPTNGKPATKQPTRRPMSDVELLLDALVNFDPAEYGEDFNMVWDSISDTYPDEDDPEQRSIVESFRRAFTYVRMETMKKMAWWLKHNQVDWTSLSRQLSSDFDGGFANVYDLPLKFAVDFDEQPFASVVVEGRQGKPSPEENANDNNGDGSVDDGIDNDGDGSVDDEQQSAGDNETDPGEPTRVYDHDNDPLARTSE